MPFDPNTAKPVEGFDSTTAKSVPGKSLFNINELAQSIMENTASLGTGLVRGGTSLLMLPADIANSTKGLIPMPEKSPTGQPVTQMPGKGMTSSKNVLPWLNQYLYQPQTRTQRNIAAAGAAAPAALSMNPTLIAGTMAGGVLGQELGEEIPGGLTGNPEADRALGNVAIPVGSAALKAIPSTAGFALHALNMGPVGDIAKALLHKIPGIKPEKALPTAQELYEMGQSKALPKAELERLAHQLQVKAFPEGTNAFESLGQGKSGDVLRWLSRLVLSPEMQMQANQPTSGQ